MSTPPTPFSPRGSADLTEHTIRIAWIRNPR
jgi:hypothetical protein